MGSTVTIRLEMPREMENRLARLEAELARCALALESITVRIANHTQTTTSVVDKDSGTASTVPETADCQSPVTADNGRASDKPPHKDPPPVDDSPTSAGGGSPPSGWIDIGDKLPPVMQGVVVWLGDRSDGAHLDHRIQWITARGTFLVADPTHWIPKP